MCGEDKYSSRPVVRYLTEKIPVRPGMYGFIRGAAYISLMMNVVALSGLSVKLKDFIDAHTPTPP